MTVTVLDASAILALMNGEPGAAMVAAVAMDAVVSALNLAEVASKLSDFGLDDHVRTAAIARLDLRVRPFDEQAAFQVAWLRRPTRTFGLSLGDRACLALAQSLGAAVMTADRAWSRLDIGVEIKLIR